MYTSINIIAIAIALVMNMIQGYTLNGLNNTEKIFSFDGSQISMITVGNQENPIIISDKCVTITKSFGSRGFYNKVRNATSSSPFIPHSFNGLVPGGPCVQFKDFDGDFINQYDYYWISLKHQVDWISNYVRGAESMTICFNSTSENDQNEPIHVYEIYWNLTYRVKFVLMIICIAHLRISYYLMKRIGMLFGRYRHAEEYDDDY